jgi:hypothetical protein
VHSCLNKPVVREAAFHSGNLKLFYSGQHEERYKGKVVTVTSSGGLEGCEMLSVSPEGLGKLKKLINLIVSRTRDLPAGSIVP